MFDFIDKVVIITGAGGALGSQVAELFYHAGAKVALYDILPDDKLQLKFPKLKNLENTLFQSVNLTEEESIQNAIEKTINKFGHIDILVNIAGGFRMGPLLHETSENDFDFMIKLNTKTMFLTSKAVIPYMLKQGGGKIISISARAALKGVGKMAPYIASKSMVIRLTESMASELRDSNINVNCILPGTIDTSVNRADMPNADFSKWVDPKDLGNVILFLASEEAKGINGAAIPVYGLS
ncbi:MAG: 2-(R)-hydroxypropyl-CoM dehydrogenase [Candidatus Heimdallarchaeota archaeon LC_2]|nr:MAG: 2-(R)-hydroxypropyl-CoM dehydrogenase [Candidatus Heimdallarchaeota archaeon LC_2]